MSQQNVSDSEIAKLSYYRMIFNKEFKLSIEKPASENIFDKSCTLGANCLSIEKIETEMEVQDPTCQEFPLSVILSEEDDTSSEDFESIGELSLIFFNH